MEEHIEKLEGLGWEEPLYSTGVSIFCEDDRYMKAWITMVKNRLETWVKPMKKKLGIYDFAN